MAIDFEDLNNKEMLSSMQGNILKGHGRPHTIHIFLQFTIADKTIEWLKKISNGLITSAYKQLEERDIYKKTKQRGGLFTSFFMTVKGYKELGLRLPPDATGKEGTYDEKFYSGMSDSPKKCNVNDLCQSNQAEICKHHIHAMILLAHHDVNILGTECDKIKDDIAGFTNVMHTEKGSMLLNSNGKPIEHFGYVDGISQLLFLKDDLEDYRHKNPNSQWDPEADPSIVLVPDVPDIPSAKGSYFVFRKLEQNVRAFKTAKKKLEDTLIGFGLPESERSRVGAMLVGRYEDGTPLVLHQSNGVCNSSLLNDFNYDSDIHGTKCPLHTHIRKANPRGTGLKNMETTAIQKKKLLVRRGITYGVINPSANGEEPLEYLPENGVGLLFMSYQASIGNQFEAMQQKWINNDDFPSLGSGRDSILGNGKGEGKFAVKYGDYSSIKRASFENFITLKGGGYFFAPSITFLKSLPNLPANP